jgi:hypothetical protein
MTQPARDERRWTLWRVHVGRSVGQWNAEQWPVQGDFEPEAETVEVIPLVEHEAALAAARQVDEATRELAIDIVARQLDRPIKLLGGPSQSALRIAQKIVEQLEANVLLAALNVEEVDRG